MRTRGTSIPANKFYPGVAKMMAPSEVLLSQHLVAIRKLAAAFGVSTDMLLFAHNERGPGDDLKLQFEATSRLNPEEKNVIRAVIESIVPRNTVKAAERRYSAADSGGSTR